MHLATVALHVGHQPFVRRKTLSAEKQQMLEEMRQPRPRQWHVMTTGSHPQGSGTALEAWHMTQGHAQAVGQGFGVGAGVSRRRHGHFQNSGVPMLAD
ncbi:hypothetical protein D3C81_1611520 [compost metagenome]